MAAPPTYAIDSLHINVGQGDSAIHLLVKQPEKPGEKPTVIRACLIDGGTAGALQKIKGTVRLVKDRYSLPSHNKGEFMQFDSVVITHWDQDHYSGIESLIKEDFTNKYEALKRAKKKRVEFGTEKEAEDDNKDFNEKLKTELNTNACQCPYFRYNDTTKAPETTLYAPYWAESAAESVDGKKASTDLRGKPPDCFGEKGDTLTFLYEKKFQYTVTAGGAKKRKLEYRMEVHIKELCNICYEPKKMIGANFLNNTGPGLDYAGIDSPEDLVTKVVTKAGGTDGAPVGIYCVACRDRLIGSGSSIFKVSDFVRL